jgi:hypothetical protein
MCHSGIGSRDCRGHELVRPRQMMLAGSAGLPPRGQPAALIANSVVGLGISRSVRRRRGWQVVTVRRSDRASGAKRHRHRRGGAVPTGVRRPAQCRSVVDRATNDQTGAGCGRHRPPPWLRRHAALRAVCRGLGSAAPFRVGSFGVRAGSRAQDPRCAEHRPATPGRWSL